MKTNKAYKDESLAALKGNWLSAILATLIYMALALISASGDTTLTSIFSFKPGLLFTLTGLGIAVLIFVAGPASIGFVNAFRALYDSGNPNILSNFLNFSVRNYLHNVWLYFNMTVRIILWTLLLIIPGIIKSFAYSMAPYIAVEHPELSVSECLDKSSAMMTGHKMDLFKLYLSFIGWILLSILTCGIGLLGLIPYMNTAQAAFYKDIKGDSDPVTIII